MDSLFIGFANSTEWMDALKDSIPSAHRLQVFACKLMTSQQSSNVPGMSRMTAAISLQFLDIDGHVNYCQFRVNSWSNLPNTKANIIPETIVNQAWKLTQEWLQDHDIIWTHAYINMPTSLVALESDPVFLQWNTETKKYIRMH